MNIERRRPYLKNNKNGAASTYIITIIAVTLIAISIVGGYFLITSSKAATISYTVELDADDMAVENAHLVIFIEGKNVLQEQRTEVGRAVISELEYQRYQGTYTLEIEKKVTVTLEALIMDQWGHEKKRVTENIDVRPGENAKVMLSLRE
ncbi:MAG: hypothetical protein LBH88_02925 [Candidatus Methanoplasma sp.]|jgi:hypothetical protein|nr:hypothetical protein [Candidatus Methanoplasma sp.]